MGPFKRAKEILIMPESLLQSFEHRCRTTIIKLWVILEWMRHIAKYLNLSSGQMALKAPLFQPHKPIFYNNNPICRRFFDISKSRMILQVIRRVHARTYYSKKHPDRFYSERQKLQSSPCPTHQFFR